MRVFPSSVHKLLRQKKKTHKGAGLCVCPDSIQGDQPASGLLGNQALHERMRKPSCREPLEARPASCKVEPSRADETDRGPLHGVVLLQITMPCLCDRELGGK